MNSEKNSKRERTVYVTAYPNIAPAGTAVTREGKGSCLSVAIGRAVDNILRDDRVRGKRILLPMKLVVTE